MSAIASFLRLPSPLAVTAVVAALLPACKTLESQPEEAALIDQPTFALIDLDNDGKVSPAEMAKHKHQEGLAEFDLDNDRQISTAEWTAAKPSSAASSESFTRLDLNKDGKLTEDEAVLSITGHAPYREAFKKMDANGDGHLHWEEYLHGDSESLNVTLFSMPPATPPAEPPSAQGTTQAPSR